MIQINYHISSLIALIYISSRSCIWNFLLFKDYRLIHPSSFSFEVIILYVNILPLIYRQVQTMWHYQLSFLTQLVKGHLSVCHHQASLCHLSIVHCKFFAFKSSPLKPLCRIKQNFTVMIIEWSTFRIWSDSPTLIQDGSHNKRY